MNISLLKHRVRRFRIEAGLSRRRLQRLAGVGGRGDILRDIDKPEWNPTSATLEALERVIPEGWRPGDPVPEIRHPDDEAAA